MIRSGLTGALLLAIIACGQASSPPGIVCMDLNIGCTCQHEPPQTSQVPSCNTSVFPDTVCCAETGWPSSGGCQCLTSAIFCGVVPGYEMAADGGPGEAVCACSNDPYPEQVIGPTCYANGTTTPGEGLGSCCMFSPDAPGSLGIPSCLCSAGLHTCGTGGTPVDGCSAASFPSTPATCGPGETQVTSCL
ncbi:MAG: hypothetical protein ACLP1X_31815 [Polyangiaceae bacterium]